MRIPLRRGMVVVAVLVVLVSSTLPGTAQAGCLTEQRSCRNCASRMLKKAIFRLSPIGILEANAALWDCDIDLYHCVIFGQHHGTACAL